MDHQEHLMIDVETMGTSSLAPIIQIGACKFDSYSGEIKETYCANIDLQDAILNHGRVQDEATVKWWQEQNQDILAGILSNTRPLVTVFTEFFHGLGAIGVEKHTPIWSHATFDFPLVNTHLALAGMRPMYYRSARDIRTLCAMADLDLAKYDWAKGKTHNALDDCIFQVKYCVDAMAIIRKS